jgi:hypothetical protein
MAVNIYEKAIQPIVDLDTDVVVYVPGFAVKGPTEPTFVTKSLFTSLFGDLPYLFKKSYNGEEGNSILAGSPDRSWLYAKGLVDAGLTVLFHRQYPDNIDYAKPASYTNSEFTGGTSGDAFAIGTGTKDGSLTPQAGKAILVRAKYKGRYYAGMTVSITKEDGGLMKVRVEDSSSKLLEEKLISLKSSSENYIEGVEFANIEFYTNSGFASLGLDSIYAGLTGQFVYMSGSAKLETPLEDSKDEVSVEDFLTSLSGATSPMDVLEDTEKYTSISYITSGGYYQTEALAAKMQKLAYSIKSIALIDFSDSINNGYDTLKTKFTGLSSEMADKSKSASFIGADTYVMSGYKLVVPDSYGYLLKLGSNIQSGIPYWLPIANNPNGVVSAVATTRPVTKSVREEMLNKIGISSNPIVYKQNIGYTIMGNRTLYPNEGVLGPQSFLNCQIVVNAIERAARRAAQDLLIVSTDPNTAFRTFKQKVSKTCDKFLVNGDGLAAYSIRKIKKTRPATIDTVIDLTLREGIEEWNISVPYSLEME